MSEGDFQLNRPQIKELLQFARVRDNDVFYDLGSGNGLVIIELAKVGQYTALKHYEPCHQSILFCQAKASSDQHSN